MVAPSVLLLLGWMIVPLSMTIYFSFLRYNLLTPGEHEWIGLLNYQLFLTDPADYDGGELVIETMAGEQAIKLPAGAAIVYPATSLHRVEPVTRGERLACVGWVESRVRDPGAREILFDLERARRAIFKGQGKTAEFDLISRATANLLRRWGE